MNVTAIVLAAGAGERLGDPDGLPKALRPLGDRPMYLHAVEAFDAHPAVDVVVLVYPPLWGAQILEELPGTVKGPIELVPGGNTRGASVRAGLAAVGDAERIVVHDAARPFVSDVVIDRVLAALGDAQAAVPAIPVRDTLKRIAGGVVAQTVSRDGLVHVQTPQGFTAAVLRRAHEEAEAAAREGTDDAALVEAIGVAVAVVEGEAVNLKVTTPDDFVIAEAIARVRPAR